MDENYSDAVHYQFKIILVGEGGVGKTCLTNRFCYSEFLDTKLTIGISFNNYTLPAQENGKNIGIGLSIWDFGGQPRFRPLLPQFITGANGIIWVYDLTSFRSLTPLVEEWLPIVQANSDSVPSILVGTKYDIFDPEQYIDKEYVNEIKETLGAADIYETSSKTGYNTSLIFKAITQQILNRPPYSKRNIKLL